MTDEFKIRWFNTSGVLQKEDTDWTSLAYHKRVNEPGIAYITYAGTHPLFNILEDKWIAEIWRRNKDFEVDWYLDFDIIFRRIVKRGFDPGTVELGCPGQLHRLSWRHVLWFAGENNRSAFVDEKAETILKTLVDYNATSNASTANGRLRAGNLTAITIQSDGAGGNTISHYCAWEELLASLQRVALIAGGDFDLVKTAATTWQFRWYLGQLGTDRTATVEFSTGKGNMGNPRYEENHIKEKTIALVAGKGEGKLRENVERTGDNYHVTTNNIETFADARNVGVGDTTGLNAVGDAKLDKQKLKGGFTFDVLQTPKSYYGKHYFLGDLAKAVSPYTGVAETKKIKGISVAARQRGTVGIQVYTENA